MSSKKDDIAIAQPRTFTKRRALTTSPEMQMVYERLRGPGPASLQSSVSLKTEIQRIRQNQVEGRKRK